MTEIDTDKLRAISLNLPLSEGWMHEAIRHCQRNMDFGHDDEGNQPDRYDGTDLARLANMLPAILAMAEDRDRSEKHRNDLADKITEQSVEIGALKAEVERLREIVAILPIGEMVGRMGWKNWEQARDGLLRALGKEPS